MSKESELSTVVADVARSLPLDQLELAANALCQLHVLGPAALEALQSLVPTEPFRTEMEQLVKAWAKAPEIDGAAVSLALHAASAGYRTAKAESQLEVVWWLFSMNWGA